MKYGMNLLLWSGELNEGLIPILEKLKAKTGGRLRIVDPSTLSGRTVADWLAPLPPGARRFVEMLVRVATSTDAPTVLDAGAAARQLRIAAGPGVRYVDGGWGSLVRSMVAAPL